MPQMKAPAELAKQVERFNRACPVGSPVTVRLDSGEVRTTTVTREAALLGGHMPVAWVDGIAGAYLLDRIAAAGGAG
jgi:hypothetical protein